MSKDRKPMLDPETVRGFVGSSHGKFDVVKELLEKEPALVNACADVGGGDFETALGAASHVGNRKIATYLLANGARMDVFCAAMMGKVELVKAYLADEPEIVNLKGPHGISLIAHARNGGADDVVELLEEHGA